MHVSNRVGQAAFAGARTLRVMRFERTQEKLERRRARAGAQRDIPEARRWNHNIHYHRRLLAAVPPHAVSALDVGCGNGMLSRELRAAVPYVVGLDVDLPMVELARSETDPDLDGIEFVHGDLLSYPFVEASFDIVASVVAVHQMDSEAALARMFRCCAPEVFSRSRASPDSSSRMIFSTTRSVPSRLKC